MKAWCAQYRVKFTEHDVQFLFRTLLRASSQPVHRCVTLNPVLSPRYSATIRLWHSSGRSS